MAELNQTNQDYLNALTRADVSPVATPKHLAAMLQVVQEQIRENLLDPSGKYGIGVNTEWATLTQLAKIFGVSRRTMDRSISELLSKHTIGVIQLSNHNGQKGHRRFRIEDVEKAMLEEQLEA